VQAPEPAGDLPIGREIAAAGSLRAAPPWERGYLARNGIAEVLESDRIRLTGGARGGLAGAIDGIRDRAAAALGSGTSPEAAALLRGFVLGEADRIDAATVSDFRRSGLAHLLAVSGENVLLLALLATPVLALLGVPLRARMIGLLALIALYVVVTGASPSIQRAGIMGAAGVVAALAGRPRARWYAVLLAATATLALNPRATGDPGWQLSFAAVIGLMLGAAPIRDLLVGGTRDPSALRCALAEGAGVTISATLATAPLIAADFGVASVTTLPANLLALPAVAPVMWLGMIVSALGQVTGLPVAPLTALAGALGGYIAQIAHWLGSPAWAQASVPEVGVPVLALLYAGLAVSCWLSFGFLRRRRGSRPRGRAVLLATACTVIALAAMAGPPGDATPPTPTPGLRIEVLDVGQGDAILLDPAPGLPVLVDGGPPGDGIAGKLRDAGVSRLAAAVVTHDQSDHAGGIEDLLGYMPIDHLVYGEPVSKLLALGRARGAAPLQVADGSEIDSGRLRLEFIWPPRALESQTQARSGDPNLTALVAVARWRRFAILLTADAEAADVPVAPGPIDVMKIAHHGSDDPGLSHLLEETKPRLAIISVGADNPYGHPTASTLATLAAHGVPVKRTDLDGTIEIDVGRRGWSAHPTG
jgi:competence protein ComEC